MNNFIMINNNIINLNDVSNIYLSSLKSITIEFISGRINTEVSFSSKEETLKVINDIYDEIRLR